MSPAVDRELWRCAASMIELHGEAVGDHLVNRIRMLDPVADHDQIGLWLKILDRVQHIWSVSACGEAH